jgi:hypothetical protein
MPKIYRSEEDRIGDLEIAFYNYRKAFEALNLHPYKDCTFYRECPEKAERDALLNDWKAKRDKVVALAKQLDTLFDVELITLP